MSPSHLPVYIMGEGQLSRYALFMATLGNRPDLFPGSGYLSYVLNQRGWDIGRLGAQGLYNYCTRTNSLRPGDLVFFKNTYAAPEPPPEPEPEPTTTPEPEE